MTDPTTFAGYKLSTLIGVGAGSTAAAMLMGGPWYLRMIAGAVGGLFASVGTPIFAPLVEAGFAALYGMANVPAARIPADSISGFTGFVLGLTGIDICRWIIDRTKGGLSGLRLPWPRRARDP